MCRGAGVQLSGDTVSRLTPDPAGDFDKLFASEAPSVDWRKTYKSPIVFLELQESGSLCGESLSHKPFASA